MPEAQAGGAALDATVVTGPAMTPDEEQDAIEADEAGHVDVEGSADGVL